MPRVMYDCVRNVRPNSDSTSTTSILCIPVTLSHHNRSAPTPAPPLLLNGFTPAPAPPFHLNYLAPTPASPFLLKSPAPALPPCSASTPTLPPTVPTRAPPTVPPRPAPAPPPAPAAAPPPPGLSMITPPPLSAPAPRPPQAPAPVPPPVVAGIVVSHLLDHLVQLQQVRPGLGLQLLQHLAEPCGHVLVRQVLRLLLLGGEALDDDVFDGDGVGEGPLPSALGPAQLLALQPDCQGGVNTVRAVTNEIMA